jgi:hypothetical protein
VLVVVEGSVVAVDAVVVVEGSVVVVVVVTDGLSVKLPEVPVLPAGGLTEVTVKVVGWASKRVTEAVACPEALKLRALAAEQLLPRGG